MDRSAELSSGGNSAGTEVSDQTARVDRHNADQPSGFVPGTAQPPGTPLFRTDRIHRIPQQPRSEPAMHGRQSPPDHAAKRPGVADQGRQRDLRPRGAGYEVSGKRP